MNLPIRKLTPLHLPQPYFSLINAPHERLLGGSDCIYRHPLSLSPLRPALFQEAASGDFVIRASVVAAQPRQDALLVERAHAWQADARLA